MKHYILTNTTNNSITLVNGSQSLAKALECSRQYIDQQIKQTGLNHPISIKGKNFIINQIDTERYDKQMAVIDITPIAKLRHAYANCLNIKIDEGRVIYVKNDINIPADILSNYCWSRKAIINIITEKKQRYIEAKFDETEYLKDFSK